MSRFFVQVRSALLPRLTSKTRARGSVCKRRSGICPPLRDEKAGIWIFIGSARAFSLSLTSHRKGLETSSNDILSLPLLGAWHRRGKPIKRSKHTHRYAHRYAMINCRVRKVIKLPANNSPTLHLFHRLFLSDISFANNAFPTVIRPRYKVSSLHNSTRALSLHRGIVRFKDNDVSKFSSLIATPLENPSWFAYLLMGSRRSLFTPRKGAAGCAGRLLCSPKTLGRSNNEGRVNIYTRFTESRIWFARMPDAACCTLVNLSECNVSRHPATNSVGCV